MKFKTLFYTVLFLLFTTSIFAAEVTLSWDENTESDLAGYKVYYGTSTGTYTSNADVGNFEIYIVTGLVEGQTYFFAVTAYDLVGNESGYSNEVSYDVPDIAPTPPTGLRLSGVNALTWERGDMVSYKVYKNGLFDGDTIVERYYISGRNKEVQTWNVTTVRDSKESDFSSDFKVKYYGWKAREII